MDFSLTLFERCSHAATCGCKKAHDPASTVACILVVEVGDPDPRAGKKGEMLRGDSVPMRVFRSAWPG